MTEVAERLVAEAIEPTTKEPQPATGTDMQKAPQRRAKRKSKKKMGRKTVPLLGRSNIAPAPAPMTFWDAWVQVKELRQFTTRTGRPRIGLNGADLEKAQQLIVKYTN